MTLAKYDPQEFLPGPLSATTMRHWQKPPAISAPRIFHPVGTAKMGAASDPFAVVDHGYDFRDRWTARRRRLGHADHHVRQYQYGDRDDRREGGEDDFWRMPNNS